MPSVLQVAQQISQEENQQQNGPNLSNLLNSLRAAHSRNPALPQQVQPAGWDKNHVLVVPAPVPSQQQHTDWSLFDVIGMENQIICYEAQMLPKLKVTGKFIEEISCSPSSPRLEPVKLQPNRDPCVFPAVAVAPPCLYGANPSYPWTRGMQPLQFSLEEQRWCRFVSGDSIEERLLKKSIKHDSRTGCSWRALFNRLFIPGFFGNQWCMFMVKLSRNPELSAHIENQKVLDHISDVVNSCNNVYHSPKQHQNCYIKTIAGPEGKEGLS